MSDLSDLPDIVHHTFEGVEYAILPDVEREDTDEHKNIIVIGSHPIGRYFTPITVSVTLMKEPIWKDRVCRMNLRAYTKAEQSQNVPHQTETK